MTTILFHSFHFKTNKFVVLILVIAEDVIVDVKLCNASRSSTIQKFLKYHGSDKRPIQTNQTKYFDKIEGEVTSLETNPIQEWKRICNYLDRNASLRK